MSREKLAGFSRDAVLYGLGNAVGRVVGLVMLPILTRVFNTGDYGAIDLLTVSYAFVLVAMKLGIPSGIQRFYYKETGNARRSMVTSCAVFLFVVACVLSIVFSLVAGPIAEALRAEGSNLRLGVIALALCLPMETTWEYSLLLLRLRRRAVLFSAFNVARVVLTPIVTYILVVTMRLGIEGVFYAKLVSLVILASSLVVAARTEWAFPLKCTLVRRVLEFALPGHPGLVIRAVIGVLPRYMLVAVAPLSSVGMFGIAFRLCSVLKMFVSSLNLAWNPFAYRNEGAHDEKQLYELAFKGLFAAIMMLAFAISLFAYEVLSVLATPEFVSASALVPGIAIYLAVDGMTVLLSTILYTRDQVRWGTYLNLMRIGVFLVISYFLLPDHHAKGLVVALAGSAVVYLAGYLWRTRLIFAFSIPWIAMASTTTLAGVALWFFRSIELSMWPTLGLKVFALALLAGVMVGLLLHSSEREALREILSRTASRGTSVA
jgi:O-antigen/teichoic acid export membrane protein